MKRFSFNGEEFTGSNGCVDQIEAVLAAIDAEKLTPKRILFSPEGWVAIQQFIAELYTHQFLIFETTTTKAFSGFTINSYRDKRSGRIVPMKMEQLNGNEVFVIEAVEPEEEKEEVSMPGPLGGRVIHFEMPVE